MVPRADGAPMHTTSLPTRGLAPIIALALAACDGAPAADAGAVSVVPRCASPREAPLRDAAGRRACTAVDADLTPSPDVYADPAGAATPVVYVAPGGGGGDGSRGAPFHDLTAALATHPATVMLARGAWTLDTAVTLTASVSLVGAGDTTLRLTRGDASVRVDGADVVARVSRLTLARDGAAGACDATGPDAAGLVVRGAGAVLVLRDVALDGDGVLAAQGATLDAQGLTVTRARCDGVAVRDDAVAFVRRALVRDGGRVGVAVERATVEVDTALVASNARDGVVLRGGHTGVACARDEDCAAIPAREGFAAIAAVCVRSVETATLPAVGRCRSVQVLTRLAAIDDGVTAMRAERSLPTADEVTAGARESVLAQPGALVRASRVVLAGARRPAGLAGGDGLYVGPGAQVSLDDDIAREADQGLGSELVANARTGALVDGDPSPVDATGVPEALRQSGSLSLAGGRVAQNLGPGVYVQQRARVEALRYTVLEGNTAVGLGVSTRGRVAGLFCDRFVGTRAGALSAAAGAPTFGDGVALSEPEPDATVRIEGSEFSDNARFGLVFSGYAAARVVPGANNRGAGNAYGVQAYGAGSTMDSMALVAAFSMLRGAATAPEAPQPTPREVLTLPR